MAFLLILGLLVAGLCPCVHGCPVYDAYIVTQGGQQKQTPVDNLRLAASNANFAFSLYKQLALKNPNENVIFSPVSISIALAFLSLGARGATQTEIFQGLKLNPTDVSETQIHRDFQHLLCSLNHPNSSLQLRLGNAMFVNEQERLLDKFRADAWTLFASEAFTAPFWDPRAAERLINNFVKERTQGKIVELVKGVDPNTAIMLVNYIFFKATWERPFNPMNTRPSPFYLSNRRPVTVSMMKIGDLRAPYFRDEALSCTVVELRYSSNHSALFILPDEGRMRTLEVALSPETLTRWRESLQMTTMDLYLPKFSISSQYDLKRVLPLLGMRTVFTHHADLSGVTGVRNVEVTGVVHKALIDVDEEGTEAAAATGISAGITSIGIEPLTVVRFNRPFLLSIIAKDTQSILFFGKVAQPNEDDSSRDIVKIQI